ncbi:MAG: PIN domain-containing protein [Candidatus Bathyarchaeia archaeon]
MIILDSYAWIEYFLGSESGRVVKNYIDVEEAVTSSIILTEVARKYLLEGTKEEDVVKRLNFIVANSNIMEINVEASVAAAKAYLELSEKAKIDKLKRPSLADELCWLQEELSGTRSLLEMSVSKDSAK